LLKNCDFRESECLAHDVLIYRLAVPRSEPAQREATTLKAFDIRSLTIVWALVLATPIAAMSQSSADASTCSQERGPACQASVLSVPTAGAHSGARFGFTMTDPTMLVVLGTGLLSLGLWTRRVLPGRRGTSSG
jgi:hypothetical protein